MNDWFEKLEKEVDDFFDNATDEDIRKALSKVDHKNIKTPILKMKGSKMKHLMETIVNKLIEQFDLEISEWKPNSRGKYPHSFKDDFDEELKQAYIDNIACILMDELGGKRLAKKDKVERDRVAELILNKIFKG